MSPINALEVSGLHVRFRTEGGTVHAVDDVSFTLEQGELLAIVGESGSGKSATAHAILGLLPTGNSEVEGSVQLADGTELVGTSDRAMQAVRGARVALIPQDPMTALTAVYRVGDQIAEQIRAHERTTRQAARARAVELLSLAGIRDPEARSRSYPHQLSGGMRQRVMIAMALSCSPELLIADEPTTALDVTTQKQILREIDRLRAETGIAVLLITHDLGVVAEVADRALVMYAGRLVEEAPVAALFTNPLHPYTWGLLGSLPRPEIDRGRRLPTIIGAPPVMSRPMAGCRFAERCPHRMPVCAEEPELRANAPDHLDRCHLGLESKQELRMVSGGTIGLPAPGEQAS
jgi:peptide/nickel transport system ATP-binding protein/oligopeptide transport system ATP-binding protein